MNLDSMGYGFGDRPSNPNGFEDLNQTGSNGQTLGSGCISFQGGFGLGGSIYYNLQLIHIQCQVRISDDQRPKLSHSLDGKTDPVCH